MKKRRTKSLYGKTLKKALLHAQPKLRSEYLPEYTRFYVDNGTLELLHNNDHHLISGRRGTGKTHLLGAFHEMINQDCEDELSVMISLAKLDSVSFVPSQGENNSSETAHALYHDFLRKLFPRILNEADDRLNTLSKTLHKDLFKQLFSSVNNLLTELLETVELGRPIEIEANQKTTVSTEQSSTGSAGGKVELGLSLTKPSAGGKLSLGKGTNHEKIEQTTVERISELRIDYIRAGELIAQIIEELNVSVLHILIDEWMELDKRTPSGIQPIFAQLLKKTFFDSKYISVKIASVWHQTSLYDRDVLEKSKGLELKHDIIKSVDLDTAFLTDESEVFTFCKKLLFKRVLFACEEARIEPNRSLANMMDEHGHVDDIFITEIFDNVQNFKSFITASHAIPRDLMNIFHLSSLLIRRNFEEQCIDHEIVHRVAKNQYKTDKRKTISPNSNAQKLLQIINRYMDEHDRRLFLVENSQVPKSDALQKLVDEELIHQVPSAVTHRSICDSHKSFLIDFGNFVDLIETKSTELSRLLNESVLADFPDEFDDHIGEYTIDISVIESEYLKCNSCSKSFSVQEPVYKKASMCVYCANVVE